MLPHLLQIMARLYYCLASVGDLEYRASIRIKMGVVDIIVAIALFFLTSFDDAEWLMIYY